MVVGALLQHCDVAVIGAGPGGYVAAIQLARRGKQVTLIERRAGFGGVCLHEGCIPSKALIHVGDLVDQAKHADTFGINFRPPEIDFGKTIAWKESVVTRLSNGIRQLLKRSGVEVLHGTARFASAHQIDIETREGVLALTFEQAIIASGSRPKPLPNIPFDGVRCCSSTDALSFASIPERLIVIGGGYIGLELGSLYRKLGSAVSIVEALPTLLPSLDREVGHLVAKKLQEADVTIYLNHRLLTANFTDRAAHVTLEDANGITSQIEGDRALVCIGRLPNSDQLNLSAASVTIDPQGRVVVNPQMRTSDPNIYAIGDVVDGPPLAHKAYREAQVVADAIMGERTALENPIIPAVIYTDPEIAWVGLTEREATEQGIDAVCSKFPFSASGRALTLSKPDGFVKLVAEKLSGRILGVQIVGVNAGELISSPTLSIELGAYVDDLSQTIHPHPTLSEALQEAALCLMNRSSHHEPT